MDKAGKKTQPEVAVLVTTEHRGVFFGYTRDVQAEPMALRAARNIPHWTRAEKGFLGLAYKGPSDGCRVGPPADMPRLEKITCVALCTPEAVTAWEKAPWQA